MQNFQNDKQHAIEELLNMNKKSTYAKTDTPIHNPQNEHGNIKKRNKYSA